MKEKIWSLLLHIYPHYGDPKVVRWEEGMWDYILEEAPKAGFNTIVLDLNSGIEWATHPEIAIKNSWSRKKLRDEIKRIREKGMIAIPKINFSAQHSFWMGEYSRMISTPQYYKVCNDLIKEAYELFDHPEYIHIGMDEEDVHHARHSQFVCCRQGELYWHDLRYLIDCVADTGAKPWIWSCPLFTDPEGFKKHISPDEVILSPWHYNALRRDHWTPITSRQEYVTYYNEGEYAKMGIEFVEQDPFLVRFMEVALPLMKEGYKYAPCASVYNRCDWNHHDLMEYFKENANDDQIVGYMSAPWAMTYEENKPYFDETFKFFKEAKDDFYK